MKKLLSLIGGINLVGTSLVPVVACQAAIQTTNKAAANAIKNKITDVNLIIPLASAKTVQANNPAIKKALKDDNQTLTFDDLAKITFASGTFTPGTPLNVMATITIGTATATKNLIITMEETDQQKANAIKNKISDVDLTVPAGTDPSTANAATVAAIKTALKADNTSLTAADLNTITFNNTTLVTGQSKNVTATITIGSGAQRATATKRLSVTLAQTPQQKANAIKNKITNNVLTVPTGTNPSTGNPGTVTAIKTALKADNTSLTDDDLAKMGFNNITLISGTNISVTATINVGSGAQAGTATKILHVTLTRTNQAEVDFIARKITNIDVTVPNGTNTSTGNEQTIAAIKTALKRNNIILTGTPTGTTGDLSKITFATKTLVHGQSTLVLATIRVGSAASYKRLYVTLARAPQAEADFIAGKINTVAFNIDFNATKTVEANTAAIKAALKVANTTLTTADLEKITFTATGSFVPGTAKAVTATITVGSATATKALQVTMQTAQQTADAIKNKISDSIFNIDFNATTKTITDNTTAIKKALKDDNTSLTTADLAKISFSTGTFTPDTALSVTATITVGSTTAAKTLDVTMLTAQNTANAIKAKITNNQGAIIWNANTTFAANTAAIKTKLKADNPALTTADLAKITFDAGTFIPGSPFPDTVIATITVGSATATKSLYLRMFTAQTSVNVVKATIDSTAFTIPPNGTKTIAANTTAIKTVLKADNPALTAGGLAKINFIFQFPTTAFVEGQAVTVILIINIERFYATQDLSITMLTS